MGRRRIRDVRAGASWDAGRARVGVSTETPLVSTAAGIGYGFRHDFGNPCGFVPVTTLLEYAGYGLGRCCVRRSFERAQPPRGWFPARCFVLLDDAYGKAPPPTTQHTTQHNTREEPATETNDEPTATYNCVILRCALFPLLLSVLGGLCCLARVFPNLPQHQPPNLSPPTLDNFRLPQGGQARQEERMEAGACEGHS